ncbi:ATP-binding protein [Methanoregula sp.]|uniref:ATP-binding protein n=1 Tax=Methanoregula sp. TaxID=2052170 RepID=UPI0035686D43
MGKTSIKNPPLPSPQVLTNAPFSQERLNEIFKTSSINPQRVMTRENSWLEFKQNFNWKSRDEYARTFAAFANTKGGYVVFGIGDKPHTLLGINPDEFEKIDPAVITGELNNYFSPELAWENRIFEFQGMSFGIIYIYESREKPIIATKNGTNISEGLIYYRYRGRTEKIRYAELRNLLDEQRKMDQELLLKHLTQIKKYGVANVGIFDLNSGIVTGSKNSFIIDESLLPKLKFIKEGQFHETKGSPTLKLMGDLITAGSTMIQPTKETERIRGIRTPDIIEEFLDRKDVKEPKEYINQICFESSSLLPVYYYMSLARLSKMNTVKTISELQSRSPSKQKLLKRIENEEDFKLNTPQKETEKSLNKLRFKEQILRKQIDDNLQPVDIRFALQAIRLVPKKNINLGYLLPLLKKWYQSYYTLKGKNSVAVDLRMAICYIDYTMFRDKIAKD